MNYERMQTQFEELSPSGGVVMLGDSITQGGRWHELLARSDAFNRGIGGDTTAGVLARIDTIVAAQPQQIFLMIGVNDLNGGVETVDTIANYEQILDTFAQRLSDTEVIVQSVLPVNSSWRMANAAAVRELNEEIVRLAGERGLPYLDLYPAFADADGELRSELSNDGIHLLGPGYALWRGRLSEHLAAH
jgi:lysophospholipase L1-like esterase